MQETEIKKDVAVVKKVTKKKATEKKATEKKAKRARVFSGDQEIFHDLYKLEVSKMNKNIALPGTEPEYREVEHCHHFHTFDSDGKKLDKCSPIGGHFHKMEVIYSDDGAPEVKCVSGPLKMVKVKRYGKVVTEVRPVNGDDNHTHELTYIKSDKLSIRKVNAEAIKVLNDDANKAVNIPGIS